MIFLRTKKYLQYCQLTITIVHLTVVIPIRLTLNLQYKSVYANLSDPETMNLTDRICTAVSMKKAAALQSPFLGCICFEFEAFVQCSSCMEMVF